MNVDKRLLATTASEQTWGISGPLLFLGKWCLEPNKLRIIRDRDYKVHPPLLANDSARLSAVVYLTKIYEREVTALGHALNLYHNVDRSTEYWRLIVGHWLRRWISLSYNRYFTIQSVIKANNNLYTFVPPTRGGYLAAPDSLSFILKASDDQWNFHLWSRFFDSMNVNIVKTPSRPDQMPQRRPIRANGVVNGLNFRMVVRKLLTGVLPKFVKATDPVIAGVHMSKLNLARLYLLFGATPQWWNFDYDVGDLKKRDKFDFLQGYGVHVEGTDFHSVVRRLLPEVIPKCYLEGYKNLVLKSENLRLPKKPRFIFTSNFYDTNELFKVWSADKVERGVKYFVGQHGNNYGTHFYFGDKHWPERSSTTGFLTWGWSEKHAATETIRTFNPHITKKVPLKKITHGRKLLIFASCANQPVMPWDVAFEHCDNRKLSALFIDKVPATIRSQILLRLHRESTVQSYGDHQFWSTRFPDLRIDTGTTNQTTHLRSARLSVYLYDSTGVLDRLTENRPCVALMPRSLSHVSDSAMESYRALQDVGILFDSPSALAEHISQHWDNVISWWASPTVQMARAAFCQRYSRFEPEVAIRLRDVLKARL